MNKEERINALIDAEAILLQIVKELEVTNVKCFGFQKSKWIVKYFRGKQDKFDSFEELPPRVLELCETLAFTSWLSEFAIFVDRSKDVARVSKYSVLTCDKEPSLGFHVHNDVGAMIPFCR